MIRRAAGVGIEREAREKAPIRVGEAITTSGGESKFKAIVHAPTMARPSMRIPPQNVYKATLACLRAADRSGLQSLAIPGMGVGIGNVGKGEAARLMLQAIKDFSPEVLRRVVLVDVDQRMVNRWKAAL